MIMHTKIRSQETHRIVTLNDAKRQLNIIDNTDDDLHIQLLIDAAIGLAETFTNRMLSSGVVDLVITGKNKFYLPYGEVTEVNTPIVATVTSDPVEFTFNPISQVITITDEILSTDEVMVTYDAGYAHGDVPKKAVMGILMLIASMWENRENNSESSVNEIPLNSQQLLGSIKIEGV